MKLGDKIREYRKFQGVSQFNLELEIGAAPGSLSRIENNIINPTKETINKIATALNISSSELLILYDNYLDGYSKLNTVKISKDYKIQKIDLDELNKLLITDFLDNLDKTHDFISSSFSRVNFKLNIIQLTCLSNSIVVNLLKPKIIKQQIFKNIQLKGEKITLTKECVISKSIKMSNTISDFISPPLDKSLTSLIQKLFGIQSMVSLPLLQENDKCYGVINIALKTKIENLSAKDLEMFRKIMHSSSKIISKIGHINISFS